MGEGGGSKQTEKYCTWHKLNLSTEQDFFTTVLKKIKVPASLLKKSTDLYNSTQAFLFQGTQNLPRMNHALQLTWSTV